MGISVENSIILTTRDVDGKARDSGGDPVEVVLEAQNVEPTRKSIALNKPLPEEEVKKIKIVDNNDGTYAFKFRLVGF